MEVDPEGASWRKSTYSNGTGGNCVEVADLPNGRAVRDSKRREGPVLMFTTDAWQAFVRGIKARDLCAEPQAGRGCGTTRIACHGQCVHPADACWAMPWLMRLSAASAVIPSANTSPSGQTAWPTSTTSPRFSPNRSASNSGTCQPCHEGLHRQPVNSSP
jgi:hypothetical protein